MIKLTAYSNGAELYINHEHIVSVYALDEGKTEVVLTGDVIYRVKEGAYTIASLKAYAAYNKGNNPRYGVITCVYADEYGDIRRFRLFPKES